VKTCNRGQAQTAGRIHHTGDSRQHITDYNNGQQVAVSKQAGSKQQTAGIRLYIAGSR